MSGLANEVGKGAERDPATGRVLIIIPSFNEQGRIGSVVDSVRREMPGCDVAVINDDSSDATGREACAAGARVLPHPINLGYGVALETGYRRALSGAYDIVVQMDGDGQHVAAEIPRLIAPVASGEADIAIGSRYLAGSSGFHPSLAKRVGRVLFSAIIRAIAGLRISDPTSGFQALNRRSIRLFASGVFPCDYPDADVVIMAAMCGLRIREVPVAMRHRSGGASMHAGLKPLYYLMKMLLSVLVVVLNWGIWHRWRRAFESGAGAQEEAS